ncbi:MAG: hypothetical protein RLZ92_20 [Pseudomonadota bacterium]|jgi:hypothetical protein
MIRQSVHMRDQKANQIAMIIKANREANLKIAEEITMILVLWGLVFLTMTN